MSSPDRAVPGGFLSGYRVLDLTDERGMIAGRMLADLGADVVQVEPPGGSTARRCPPLEAESRSLYFDAYAANKRGIVADPDGPDGQRLIRELASAADIVIESADPGVMAARGLDWPDLRQVNPRLIYVSVTAFGRTGPKAGYAESDLTVWAAGGPLDLNRDDTRPPVRISLPQAYLHAGADAAAGALFALQARHRIGRGQHVDVSAQASLGTATLAQVLAYAVGDSQPSLQQPVRQRGGQGSSGPATPPFPTKWPCRDGTVECIIGLGPAVGGFTGAFMRWMADEGAAWPELLAIDWRALPSRIEDGTFTSDDLAKVGDAVAAFLAVKTKREVLRAAVDRKLLCVPIYDTADVASSEQLAARDFWVEVGDGERRRRLPGPYARVNADAFAIRRPAPRPGEHTAEVTAEWLTGPGTAVTGQRLMASPAPGPEVPGEVALPLDGLKVLDLSWVVAGPVIGRALADFGATVVRVESSTRVETARHVPPFYGGVPAPENSALYITWNCGKLGVTADLSTERGREVVQRLAEWSDVVLESFSPGQMQRWGLDYAALSAHRPDLIMLSTALMGQTGPDARLAGYGNIGAALSGFQNIAGWPDRPPIGPYGAYTDYLGPRFSLTTLLAALDHRQRTGAGCYIDVAQIEAGVYLQSPEMADYARNGTVVHRIGNADRLFAPHGVYRCRPDDDGTERFVAIAVRTDEQWQQLATLMGRADLAADPELAAAAGRLARAADLDPAVEAWTAGQRAEDVERCLQASRIPAHVSASSRDFCTDPQLAHRGHLIQLPDPRHGTATVEGPRYLLSETPGRVSRTAPDFGQDNEYVLTELLGYSPDEVRDLTHEGVLR
jgi:crotonobetainyl-CoA:carnitine CoA-transferase CaiB-like acyl-CoA transferase